ncbi:hypothetical protein QEN19_000982 [Hanseniaspora menglaensis]
MDQSDLVGSKKNKGIYSQQLLNLKRKQQVDSIIGNQFDNDDNLVNYQDKILCKLCNTLHVNIISYQRHIRGKKHLTKIKIKEKRSKKVEEQELNKGKIQSEIVKSDEELRKDKFLKQYTANLIQKHQIKNKNTKFYNIGLVLPVESIETEYTIDNSTKSGDEDTIGLLVRLKVESGKDASKILFKKYLSKEELSINNIKSQNDLLLLHLPEYKPIIISIPEKMSLIGGANGMIDCKIDDCWYLQISLLIRN